jgi:chromosome segregation ATPase
MIMKFRKNFFLVVSLIAQICLPLNALAKEGSRRDLFFRPLNSLIKNVSNTQALLELQQHLVENQEESQERMQLQRFTELAEYCGFLETQIRDYRRQQETLMAFVADHPLISKEFKSAVQAIRQEFTQKEVVFKKQLATEHPPSAQLEAYVAALAKQRDILIARLDVLRDVNSRLREIKGQAVRALNASVVQENSSNWKKRVDEIQRESEDKNETIAKQEALIRELTHDLGELETQFNNLNQTLVATNQELNSLRTEFAGLSLEVYDKETSLATALLKTETLQTYITDLEERLMLARHLITEKEERIHLLESGSDSQQGLVKSNSMLQTEPQNPELDLTTVKPVLEAGNPAENWEVQIKDLQQKVAHFETELVSRTDENRHLAEQLQIQEDRVKVFSLIFLSKDQKLMELNGILQLYKGKLADVSSVLQKREAQMQHLEEQMIELMKRLSEGKDRLSKPKSEALFKASDGGLKLPQDHHLDHFSRLTHDEIIERTKQDLKTISHQINELQYISNRERIIFRQVLPQPVWQKKEDVAF